MTAQTPRPTNPVKSAKKGLFAKAQKWILKIFDILKKLAHLVWLVVENVARLTIYCFSLLVKLLSSPTTPCLVAILCFGAVCTIAAWQWFIIGIWWGHLVGFNGAGGIGSGAAGVLLGLGLNTYQLAPQLWRLRKDIGEAYKTLGINPGHESKDDENVPERLENWLSIDHSTLKNIRLATYAIETALVLGYCFAGTGLNFFALAQAGISLILPEKCLGLVSSTIAVLGAVSDKIHTPDADNATF